MQDLIKRYFWVLGALVTGVCVTFAAKATNNVVEAKFLGDAEHGPHVVPTAPTPTAPVKPTRSKDPGPVAQRDIFCSDCTPTVSAPIDNGSTVLTSLPLILLATNVGTTDADSYATVVNTSDQHQGSYGIGDPIPGATGKLKVIHKLYIDFENNGHIERLVLPGQQAPVTTHPTVVENTPPSGDDIEDMAKNGIKKIDDNNYEIDRNLIAKVLENPMGLAKYARIVPSMKDGKPDGFKMYGIRPNSPVALLGLQNGDTLDAVNGFAMTSANSALDAYMKLRDATTLSLDITRKGKQMNVKYVIK